SCNAFALTRALGIILHRGTLSHCDGSTRYFGIDFQPITSTQGPTAKSCRYHRPIVSVASLVLSWPHHNPIQATIRGAFMISERIRVFMVDDHPLLSEGLVAVIQNQPDMLPVGQAFSGREAIQRFDECKPDVTLMDLRLPDMSGIDAMIAIRAKIPGA